MSPLGKLSFPDELIKYSKKIHRNCEIGTSNISIGGRYTTGRITRFGCLSVSPS